MPRPIHVRARARAAVALIIAVVLVAAPSSVSPQGDDQREAPEVRDLVLNGVHGVNRRDLERSIATTQSECKSLLLQPFCWSSRSKLFWAKKYFSRDEFRRDVLRVLVFYWKRGYREAEVDTAVTPLKGGVRVAFNIREGPPTVIASLRVEYDSTLIDERRVQRMSILRAGDPLNLVVLDTMRLNLQLWMWDRGHADAQVDTVISVDAAARTATVLLRAIPNWLTTVGSITVRGNQEVTVGTIQNSIMLRPGRVFRYVDLAESQRNLYESNLFRLAQFTIAQRPDSVKNINIELRETKMQEARIAGGINNIDFVQTNAGYTNYNMFGGARRLDLLGVVGNLGASGLQGHGIFRATPDEFDRIGSFQKPTWQVAASLKQPAWLRKPENALTLTGFAHRRSSPSVYIDRGYGGELNFTRTLAPRAAASAGYRYEVTRVEAGDVYFCVNYGVCDIPTVASLRQNQRLSPVLLSSSIDRSDVPFSPTKGYIARVDYEHASRSTFSDYKFNRIFAEGSAYTHFRYPSRDPRSQVLAGHLRIGYVRPLASKVLGESIDLLHPRKRFYAGGSQSVRGYDENQLGPRILTIPASTLDSAGCDTRTAITLRTCDVNTTRLGNSQFTPRPVGGTSLVEGSVEFRVPFGARLEWAAFIDGAIVGGSELHSLVDLTKLVRGAGAITPGFGIRYRSPVGPVRIDLGYNPRTVENLDVVTTLRDSTGIERLFALTDANGNPIRRRYDSAGNASGLFSVFNRVVVHLSIGQAF
ncbi:MAG: BamA/OMP85 family outer membrane protein [Gemmatimonadaceae bacterium]